MCADDALLVAVAPNGARRGKDDHPALPLSPSELAATAEQCLDAGAAMLHLHVRDEHGRHSLAPQRYARAIKAIRERTGDRLLIQATTEAAGVFSIAEQLNALEQTPAEGFSLALRELLPADAAEEQNETVARALRRRWESGAWLQYILYEPPEIERFFQLRGAGVIPGNAHSLLFVVGRCTEPGHTPDPDDLGRFLQTLDAHKEQDYEWMVCAFGSAEYPCAREAALRGGNIRVGFENNLDNRRHRRAADNAELVQQAAAAARDTGRTPVNAAQLRQRLIKNFFIHAGHTSVRALPEHDL